MTATNDFDGAGRSPCFHGAPGDDGCKNRCPPRKLITVSILRCVCVNKTWVSPPCVVMVMRDGEYVGEGTTKEIDRDQLIEMMVGRSLEQEFPVRLKDRIVVGDQVKELP